VALATIMAWWRMSFNLGKLAIADIRGLFGLKLIGFCFGYGICAALTGVAVAQHQSDQLGPLLGTSPVQPSAPSHGGKPAHSKQTPDRNDSTRVRVPITLRAGQSVTLRAGTSALAQSSQPGPAVFKVGRKPNCGEVWGAALGVILAARSECVGQTLEFDYEVGFPGASGAERAAVKVDVQAIVLPGLDSCGIVDAPYEFISIPGGSYLLKSASGPLSDLAKLVEAKSALVDAFCISEEAIPSSEMDAFLAGQTLAQKRRAFPEALELATQPAAQVEVGRGLRAPALAVSHRMAQAYAQKQSERLERRFELPRLEHYLAAAAYLLRHQPDAPATHSFLVSLRGGLLEWTDTPCGTVENAFLILGTEHQSGLLEKYCYDVSQRIARMGFRLVVPAVAGGDGLTRPPR
jgi:hypothetical protein